MARNALDVDTNALGSAVPAYGAGCTRHAWQWVAFAAFFAVFIALLLASAFTIPYECIVSAVPTQCYANSTCVSGWCDCSDPGVPHRYLCNPNAYWFQGTPATLVFMFVFAALSVMMLVINCTPDYETQGAFLARSAELNAVVREVKSLKRQLEPIFARAKARA